MYKIYWKSSWTRRKLEAQYDFLSDPQAWGGGGGQCNVQCQPPQASTSLFWDQKVFNSEQSVSSIFPAYIMCNRTNERKKTKHKKVKNYVVITFNSFETVIIIHQLIYYNRSLPCTPFMKRFKVKCRLLQRTLFPSVSTHHYFDHIGSFFTRTTISFSNWTISISVLLFKAISDCYLGFLSEN